jgi:hypothetical protein
MNALARALDAAGDVEEARRWRERYSATIADPALAGPGGHL